MFFARWRGRGGGTLDSSSFLSLLAQRKKASAKKEKPFLALLSTIPANIAIVFCKNKKATILTNDGFDEEGRLPTFPHFGAVSLALVGLTSLFGMGRGGALPL